MTTTEMIRTLKAKGYTIIFTDVGPESLERDAPEVFRDLVKQSSGDGVQVMGFRSATSDGGMFRDFGTRRPDRQESDCGC